MDITQITRHIKASSKESSRPSKEFEISEKEFKVIVSNWPEMTYVERAINGDEGVVKFISGAYLNNGKKILRYTFIHGQIRISYDGRLSDDIVLACSNIANQFKATVLSAVHLEYPKSKILAAQKRQAKQSKEPKVEYQQESFGGNNMWLAIRSNINQVKDFFSLDGDKLIWQEALQKMYACQGLFLFEFRGWVFIAGQQVEILFNYQVNGEKAIEKWQVDTLLKWGKTFTDVQLFMNYNKSMYFNAFYRVLNGIMIYGEYETESYQCKYGKLPKHIKDLPDNNVNTVAIEWSYDPDYLRYQKELENAQAWVMSIK